LWFALARAAHITGADLLVAAVLRVWRGSGKWFASCIAPDFSRGTFENPLLKNYPEVTGKLRAERGLGGKAGGLAPRRNCASRERFFVVARGPQGHRDSLESLHPNVTPRIKTRQIGC
jgi:hypothetical protein